MICPQQERSTFPGSGQYEIELVVTDKVGNELTVRYANVDLGQPALSCSLSAQGWSSTLPTASYVADGNGSSNPTQCDLRRDSSPNNGSIPFPPVAAEPQLVA